MKNWFPLTSKIFTNQNLKQMPVTAKVLFALLASEDNLHLAIGNEEFYISDRLLSIAFNCSKKTIQRNRKMLAEKGLIKYREGFLNQNDRGVATTYKNIKYSTAEECTEVDEFSNYVRIHRYSFRQVLEKYNFNLKDAWTYLFLRWWENNNSTESGDFFIPKKAFKKYANCKNADKNIENIYNNFAFSSGSHLFEYEDLYKKIIIRDFVRWEDPEEGSNEDHFWDNVNEKSEKEKINEVKRYFNELCEPTGSYYGLNELLENNSVKEIKEKINEFAEANILPQPTGTDKKTFARFIALVREGHFNISA